jgi:hypothetical protein
VVCSFEVQVIRLLRLRVSDGITPFFPYKSKY